VDELGWKDKNGYDCARYEKDKFCTTTGGYGSGWNLQAMGSFSMNVDQNVKSPVHACCTCGGGTKTFPGESTLAKAAPEPGVPGDSDDDDDE
jgi:hypothetical protein